MNTDELSGFYVLCGARQDAIDAYAERLNTNIRCVVFRAGDMHPDDAVAYVEALKNTDWETTGILVCVVVSHSPVVLDMMRETPERVLCIEDGDENPFPITDHRSPEWLANFSLGGLYGDEFGARKPSEDPT